MPKKENDAKTEQIFGRVPPALKRTYDDIDGTSMTEKLSTLFEIYEEFKAMPKDSIGVRSHVKMITRHLQDIQELANVIESNCATYEEDLFANFESKLINLQAIAESVDSVKEENKSLLENAKENAMEVNKLTLEIKQLKKKISELQTENNTLTKENYELSKMMLSYLHKNP